MMSFAGLRHPIHTVFQSYALFPHMTVAANVAFPLKMAKRPAGEIPAMVKEALDKVHLVDKSDRFPNELSGGQKQRVALARSLVNRPRLLLLDEPLGALDLKLREEMQRELIKLQRDVGVTFVFVTHSQPEALALSHRIAVMNEGRVEQIDDPSRIYGFPRNRFVADFIGNCTMLDAAVAETTHHGLRLDIAGWGEVVAPPTADVKRGSKGVLALRPEQVRIAAPETMHELKNHFPRVVRDFLYIGDVTTYVVELAGGKRIEALLANSAPGRARFFDVSQSVRIGWRHDAGIFLSR